MCEVLILTFYYVVPPEQVEARHHAFPFPPYTDGAFDVKTGLDKERSRTCCTPRTVSDISRLGSARSLLEDVQKQISVFSSLDGVLGVVPFSAEAIKCK